MYVRRNKKAHSNNTFSIVDLLELPYERKDPTTCQIEFQNQFSDYSEYGPSDEHFNDRGKDKS